MNIQGLDNVINALDRYPQELEKRSDSIPDHLKNNLVDEVGSYPSIKTGAYIQAIDWHPVLTGEAMQWQIDALKNPDVFYDGYLEFETWNRGRKTKRAARYHNKKAIENANFEPVFDVIADNAFHDSYLI